MSKTPQCDQLEVFSIGYCAETRGDGWKQLAYKLEADNAALRARLVEVEEVGSAVDTMVEPVIEKSTRIFHENERLKADLAALREERDAFFSRLCRYEVPPTPREIAQARAALEKK
jgi:hypothetical protein